MGPAAPGVVLGAQMTGLTDSFFQEYDPEVR